MTPPDGEASYGRPDRISVSEPVPGRKIVADTVTNPTPDPGPDPRLDSELDPWLGLG